MQGRIVDYISTRGSVQPVCILRIEKALTSHLMGDHRTLLHLARAQWGVVDFFPDWPDVTGQSSLKCLSIRILGSSPGGIAIGVLQNGPIVIHIHEY